MVYSDSSDDSLKAGGQAGGSGGGRVGEGGGELSTSFYIPFFFFYETAGF